MRYTRVSWPWPDWYINVCREVRRRSGNICEEPGCRHKAENFHHVVYPIGRRESPSDLLHLCWWHHQDRHRPMAVNDNFSPGQLEMKLEAG